MKRLAVFFVVLGFAVAALYFSQRRTDHTPVSANAILNMAADAQRDLMRAPMRLTHISDAEEIRIGDELAGRYALQGQKLAAEDQGLEKYVVKVGGTVAVHAHRQLPYRFHLLPDRALINAFSLPGGHVYIGRGLVDLLTTEDELANVGAAFSGVQRLLAVWRSERLRALCEAAPGVRDPCGESGTGAFGAGRPELDGIFSVAPAAVRTLGAGEQPDCAGTLGKSENPETLPRRV